MSFSYFCICISIAHRVVLFRGSFLKGIGNRKDNLQGTYGNVSKKGHITNTNTNIIHHAYKQFQTKIAVKTTLQQ